MLPNKTMKEMQVFLGKMQGRPGARTPGQCAPLHFQEASRGV